MKTKNPAINRLSDFARGLEVGSGLTMTFQGTINKIAILFLLMFASAVFTWSRGPEAAQKLMIIGLIGGLILALITIFKANISHITAPIYAIFEGLFIGGISLMFNTLMDGIVQTAVILTFAIFAAMLLLYKARIIRATEKFRSIVIAATGAIFVFYLISFIMRLFGIQILNLHSMGLIGIGISVAIVIIASLNLILDFDAIEQGVNSGAPAKMEWYAAFGLIVTLVWLYIEVLRLVWLLSSIMDD
jgi:uncharacterized YccA/Bax inhibitor family protein